MIHPNTATAVLLLSFIIGILLRHRPQRRLPPGPRKYPIIGNLLSARDERPWLTYLAFSVKYASDIIHMEGFGSSMIVLNSREAATDLLVKRSEIYSSRPRLPMMNEVIGLDWLFAFAPSDEFWRERRRVFTHGLNPANYEVHQPHEAQYTRILLKFLLDSPDEFLKHTRYIVGAITMALGYGIEVKPHDDPYIVLAEHAMEGMAAAGTPGSFWVDYFPLLRIVPKWLPGASFQQKGENWRKEFQLMRSLPFEAAKQHKDGVKPSFVNNLLEEISHCEDEEERLKQEEIIGDTAGNLYTAATDTTVSSINSFFLAMTLYPDVQHRAQRDLDDLLNGTRLPDFTDRAALPFITAIVFELFRWRPVGPLGIAHYLKEDDEYRGYFLKKGSTVIANAWAILHDEDDYPNPSVFNPDRFMKDGSLDPSVREPLAAFGFHPRTCPGKHIATSTLWLTVASVLSTMSITPAVDENGVPIKPSVEYTSGFVSHPLPFRCTIKPRSEQAVDLILAAAAGF